jgi:hypothetical protein
MQREHLTDCSDTDVDGFAEQDKNPLQRFQIHAIDHFF